MMRLKTMMKFKIITMMRCKMMTKFKMTVLMSAAMMTMKCTMDCDVDTVVLPDCPSLECRA